MELEKIIKIEKVGYVVFTLKANQSQNRLAMNILKIKQCIARHKSDNIFYHDELLSGSSIYIVYLRVSHAKEFGEWFQDDWDNTS